MSQQNLGGIQIYLDISVGIFSPSNVRARQKTLLESAPHAQALRGNTDEHKMLLRAGSRCLQHGALSESLFRSPWWRPPAVEDDTDTDAAITVDATTTFTAAWVAAAAAASAVAAGQTPHTPEFIESHTVYAASYRPSHIAPRCVLTC